MFGIGSRRNAKCQSRSTTNKIYSRLFIRLILGDVVVASGDNSSLAAIFLPSRFAGPFSRFYYFLVFPFPLLFGSVCSAVRYVQRIRPPRRSLLLFTTSLQNSYLCFRSEGKLIAHAVRATLTVGFTYENKIESYFYAAFLRLFLLLPSSFPLRVLRVSYVLSIFVRCLAVCDVTLSLFLNLFAYVPR